MSTESSAERKPGRARDPGIDARVLAVASRQLSHLGYEAMSVAAVAHEAGTTRQALYRRWPDKASLAADALLAAAAEAPREAASSSPLADLTAELADFQRGVSLPGRLSLVGTMLQDATAPEARARYQARVIAPRRARIRAILERARQLEMIHADADLDVAVSLCTGSWYALALAGQPAPEDWPARTAALVWRAVGGIGPPGEQPPGTAPANWSGVMTALASGLLEDMPSSPGTNPSCAFLPDRRPTLRLVPGSPAACQARGCPSSRRSACRVPG